MPDSVQPSRTRLLHDLPLLARLPEADIAALAARGRTRDYPAGGAIFREGEPGDSLHVVISGLIRVSVGAGSGDEATVAHVGPGDCVGELALLDGRPRSATATAVEPTRTLVVDRRTFVAWLSERPAAALALLETISLRLRRTDEALADFCFLDLPHRLAKRLLELHGVSNGSRSPRIRITQAALASMLVVSRESVNKQLNRFARDGWVTLGRGSITIRDAHALRTFA
jgi:CRP/FNR family cyclic AMP-dependent transcriptional regulator